MTGTPPSVSLVGATTSKCRSVRSMPWVQGFQEAIKLWGEMVFKCGSLGIGLIMNSDNMGSNRLNALFSPLHDSCVQERCYKKTATFRAESLVKELHFCEAIYLSQIME